MTDASEPQSMQINLDRLNAEWSQRYAQLVTELTVTKQVLEEVAERAERAEEKLMTTGRGLEEDER